MKTVTRYERTAAWNPHAKRNTHTQQWEIEEDDAGLVSYAFEVVGWVILGAIAVGACVLLLGVA